MVKMTRSCCSRPRASFSAGLVKGAQLKSYPGFPHGMPTDARGANHRPISSRLSKAESGVEVTRSFRPLRKRPLSKALEGGSKGEDGRREDIELRPMRHSDNEYTTDNSLRCVGRPSAAASSDWKQARKPPTELFWQDFTASVLRRAYDGHASFCFGDCEKGSCRPGRQTCSKHRRRRGFESLERPSSVLSD